MEKGRLGARAKREMPRATGMELGCNKEFTSIILEKGFLLMLRFQKRGRKVATK